MHGGLFTSAHSEKLSHVAHTAFHLPRVRHDRQRLLAFDDVRLSLPSFPIVIFQAIRQRLSFLIVVPVSISSRLAQLL